jgi:hypothetical protein
MRADCLKNEDIAIKEHSAWRTKNRFQNPALAIAKSLAVIVKKNKDSINLNLRHEDNCIY